MAENDIAIQVGVVLDTDDIGKQLAKIKTDKNNSIKISANLEDVKREVKKYKESLGKESNAAKLLIDVLKGQSDNKIKDYVDSIHEKYVKSPIKITLDVDTQATTANINKAVGEMQQQVQKAVDQASKSMGSVAGSSAATTANSSLSLPGASGDTKYWNELNDAIRRYSSAFDDVSAKVASWRISEDMEGNARAAVEFKNSVGEITTAIFRLQDALDAENKPILDENGNTVKEWVEVGNQYTKSFQAAEQAARKMYEELNKGYRESEKQAEQQYQMYDKMFAKIEQGVQKTSDYLSKQETEFNKLYSTAFEGKNPLEGLYAKEAESALNAYKTEIEQIKSSGETVTAEQKARIQQLHDYAQKVIEDQKRQAAEVRAYYNDLNKEYRQSEKQRSSDQQMYDKMLAQREQEFQKLADQMSKYEADFNKLYSGAFEQKNPLTGEFADKALDALQKYQDEYQNVMKAGTVATDEQKRKIEELRQAAVIAIKEQQSLQQQFNTDKRQDYSGLFGQSKEWEAALKQITDAENKLNEIQKNAFSGTNALTGDFAKEATRQIDEVKNKFAEIRKTAEESFGGAATVSKDALKKMVDDLKSDLDRLAKLEYPSDKLAAQNVDVKKAFAADALAEMEERLKSLGNSTTEYYNKIQDLKTILSTVGQVDSDPSAWAKFRNEFHMLEDEIKKFEASAQGMGQKLAAGLENNQLQQITEMVDRLNNIDEKFNGAGVERLQQSLQSLAQEYMNVIEQLQNPNLSKDEYDALASKVKELSDQFKQAQNAVKIFNDGFKNEGDLRKYEQNADALRMKFEQLQNTYANLANRNPEIAERFREVENAINGMDPKNIAEVSRQVGNLAKECGNASGQSAGLRGALTDAFGGLGSYLARFTSSYYIITKTIQGIKKMVDAVKEVDTSLVELQKVTNLTGDSLAQFTDKAYQMGAQLGRTGKDVIDATTTFSRAGYDLKEAAELAQSALVMTNVGVDIPNIESAASDMISILKAFDKQAEESMGVIDKLYNVANKEPLDFGNITQMLVTAGGTLAQSGSSLEETMGLLTGAFATMRTSSVANGLIMISQRLRGLSEDGEAIDGLVPKLQTLFSSVGINIEDQNGELRSTFDILQDLAGVWDQLSSKQKQYFGEKVAGNRQVKTLNAIMQNWDVVADTIDKANNAQGEALKGNEMYMDSIQGRMTQLQSAFQELAKSTIDSNFVKEIVSAGTEVTKLITKLGGLTPVLTTILGVVLALKGAKIVVGLKAIATAIAGIASGTTLMAGLPGILLAVASAFVMIKHNADEANSTLKQFEKAKESYEEHKTKVETLNGELKTTRERIDELEGKDSLTIIEEKELQRLKDTNSELKTQIELEEKLLDISQAEARRKASENIGFELNKSTTNDGVLGTGFFAEKVTIPDNILDTLGRNRINEILGYGGGESVSVFEPSKIEEIKLRMAALSEQYEGLQIILNNINSLDKNANPDLYSALVGDQEKLEKEITENKDALMAYYNWLKDQTEGLDYVKDAKPGSADEKFNSYLDLMNEIGNTLAYSGERLEKSEQEIFDSILSKYSDTIDELKEKSKEFGEGWQLGVPDSVRTDMKQTRDELATQAEKLINVFDQINDEDIHSSLGDILEKLLDTGNIKDVKRPIIDAAKMYKAGWKEFYDLIGSDSISTYYSTQYSEMVGNIPFTISVTPIAADGSVLSPDELDDYVYEQIDNATSLEELMENDKLENGGKGLFIHLTPAIDISPEAAEQAETKFGELLHSIDGAFEQAFLENSNGEKISVAEYLKGTLTAALEDPSYTGQALTEIYTVAKALADEGYTELQDALSQVNMPEAIRQGFGIENMNVEDLGIEHLEDLIRELMTRLGFTFEEVERALQEQIGGSLNLNIGPQMAVEVDDVVNKLFQSTDGYTKVLTKALSEQEKAGVLTGTTIQKLLSADSGLPGIADCLEKTAAGYRLNTERVNEYVNAQNADMHLNAVAGIMERQIAIENLTASLDMLTDAEARAAVESQIANYENEIVVLQAMADEAYNAVDALDALNEATKTPNEDTNQNSAKKALDAMQEAWEVGKVGTDDFKAGMDYLLGDDWYNKFNGNLAKAYEEAKKLKDRYFAEDDADSATQFMKDLAKNKLAEYNPKTGAFKLLTEDLTEVADKLGISETAAKNLFELLNAYEYKNKISIGDDAIDDADRLAAAQKRLNELNEQMIQKQEELKQAQKELNQATNEDDKAEKAAQVAVLTEEYKGLAEETSNVAEAIVTTNEAIEQDIEAPKTLEEALEQLQKYQDAIDALEKEGITCPVHLTEDRDTLVKILENPTATLTVDAKPGEIDNQINKLVEFRDAVENNPNIQTQIKATVVGLTEGAIKGLQMYQKTSKELNGKTFRSSTTITARDHATVVIQGAQDAADKLDDSDPVVEVSAQEDKENNAESVKDNIAEALKEKLPAYIKAIATNIENTKKELDEVAKDRTANIITKRIDLGDDITSGKNSNPSKEDIQNNINDIDTAIGGRKKDNGKYNYVDPAQELAKIKSQYRQIYGRIPDQAEFKTAVTNLMKNGVLVLQDEVVENLDEWINKANEIYNQNLEGTDAPDIPPVEIMTEVDKEKLKQQMEEALDEAEEEIGAQDVEVGADTSKIPGQIEEAVKDTKPEAVTVDVVQKTIGSVNDVKSKTVTQTVNVKGNDTSGTSTVQGIINKAEKGATIPIDADPKEAEKKDDSLKERIKEKVFKPVGVLFDNVINQLVEFEKRLAEKIIKPVEVQVTYRDMNTRPYAKGTKKAEEGVSLVDEKGAELIEHPKRGTFELGTNNGARLTSLDEGDVVHTAEDTKKILARLSGIGGFFRNGFSAVRSFIGNAFASGTRIDVPGPMRIRPKKKKEDDNKKTTRSTGSGSSSSSGSDSGSNNSDTSAWTNWTKQFFDWVEVKLKRLQSATKTLTDQINKAVSAAAKNAQIKKVLESIGEQIEANTQGYKEYMEMANKIGEHLSTDIVNKIKNGTIDISQYDDLTQQKIRDYQTWYEKALACEDAIVDLKKQEQELAKQTLKNIADEYDANLRLLEARQSAASSERELEAAQGKAIKGPDLERQGEYEWEYDYQKGEFVRKQHDVKEDAPYVFGEGYGDYQKEINEAYNRQTQSQREAESLQAELDRLIAEGVIAVGDETWTSYKEKIEAAIKSANQAGIEAERLKDEAYEAAMAPLGYELDRANYEESRKTQEMELGNTRGSLGDKGKRAAYQSLIEGNESQNETLKIQNDLYRQLQQTLDENSVEYQELEKKIRDNEAAMLANEQQTEEWNKAIQNLPLAEFGRKLDALAEKSDKLSHSLSVKMIKGIEITEQSYQKLIDTARESQDVLRSQNAEYSKQQRKLVRKYGEDAKTSDEYLALEAKKRANNAQIRDLDLSILQWEDASKDLDATKIGWQLDGLKTKAQELADELARKKSLGIEIDTSDYEAQIANAEEQKNKLLEQNAEYLEKQAGMDVNSEAYQELQSKIDANNASMRQLDESTVQWKKDMADLPVKELGYELDDLNFQSDSLEKNLDIKREGGKFVSEEDYRKQISLAQAEKAVLQAQNEEWEKQQVGMDKNSEAYQELQKKINANKKTMQDLDKATIKWGKDIKQIKIDEINTDLDNLKAAGGVLNKQIDIKNAKGQYVSDADYRNQIQNNNAQMAATNSLIAQLKQNQAGMDVNSDEYRNLQKEINAAVAALLDLELSNAQLEKAIKDLPITNLGYYLERYKVGEQKANDAIDYKKLIGRELVSTDYERPLYEIRRQAEILQDRIVGLKENQIGKDFYSSEYQEYQKQIDAAEQEIRNIDKKTVELKKEMVNLAVTEIGWQLDELDATADKISNLMDLNAAQGYDEEASAYKSLIENGSKRIKILEEENRLLQAQQAGMDKMSEAYQNIQSQIKSNNDEIAKIKVSQEEWNNSIIDIGIGNIQKYKDALSKSNDQLKKQKELQEAILEVEKANSSQRKIRTYVEGRGFVYQHNEDEIKKAQENLEDVVKNQLMDKLDDLIDALEDAKKNSNVYDKNGNLIGTAYSTPQLGSLSDILSSYYKNNSNTTLDIGTLRQTLGNNIIPNNSNKTSFNIGDIIINEVKNGNELAQTIVEQFPNALLQALYGK